MEVSHNKLENNKMPAEIGLQTDIMLSFFDIRIATKVKQNERKESISKLLVSGMCRPIIHRQIRLKTV